MLLQVCRWGNMECFQLGRKVSRSNQRVECRRRGRVRECDRLGSERGIQENVFQGCSKDIKRRRGVMNVWVGE